MKLELVRQKRPNSLLPALEAPCGNGRNNRASVSDSLYLLAHLMAVQEIAWSMLSGKAMTALLPPAAWWH
jgi:hypothetical protein